MKVQNSVKIYDYKKIRIVNKNRIYKHGIIQTNI